MGNFRAEAPGISTDQTGHGCMTSNDLTHCRKRDMSVVAKSDPRTSTEPQSATALAMEGAWRVVVLNDPVNLMSYVVLVFKKVFGFDENTARRHMLEVHEQGRSVVWTGLREKAEAYAFTLQQWHLTAILEADETH